MIGSPPPALPHSCFLSFPSFLFTLWVYGIAGYKIGDFDEVDDDV